MGEPPKPPPRPVASGARLSPPKVFTHFALLQHDLGDTDPGFWTPTGATFDIGRQRSFDRMMKEMLKVYPKWDGLRLAIVDLNGAKPELCGNLRLGDASVTKKGETITEAERCLETWEAASATKLAIMYAAFQLRAEVQAVADANPTSTQAEIVDKLRIRWLASQVVDTTAKREVLREKGPKVELRGGTEVLRDGSRIPLVQSDGKPIGPPKLDKIFEFRKRPKGGFAIRFQGELDDWDTDVFAMNNLQWECENAHVFSKPLPALTNGTRRPFTFFEKLWLTIEVSHDYAADECIDLIGFLYINSLLWRSGLFDPRRGGGMWVGRHYIDVHHWTAPPCPEVKTRDGMVMRAGTSAVAGCAFMTLLHQGKLVNEAESQRMKVFTARKLPFASKTGKSPHESFLTAELRRLSDVGGRTAEVEESFNKIGLGSFNNLFDIVLATVTDLPNKRKLRYAACVLDGWLIDDFGEPTYDVIVSPIPSLLDGMPPLGRPAPMPPIPAPPPAPGSGDGDEAEREEDSDG